MVAPRHGAVELEVHLEVAAAPGEGIACTAAGHCTPFNTSAAVTLHHSSFSDVYPVCVVLSPVPSIVATTSAAFSQPLPDPVGVCNSVLSTFPVPSTAASMTPVFGSRRV